MGNTVRDLWLARADQHVQDWYAGVGISKYPEDLRAYEHILWATRANVVIELGTHLGGSALWFRDRLLVMAHYGRISAPRVVTVDLEVDAALKNLEESDPGFPETITVLRGT